MLGKFCDRTQLRLFSVELKWKNYLKPTLNIYSNFLKINKLALIPIDTNFLQTA